MPLVNAAKEQILYGLEDLVGCVWQLTNEIYETGS